MLYQTKEFALKANITERTVRYYDSIGLLKPSAYQENGYRLYNEEDLLSLKRIIALKTLGFSLDEIMSLKYKESTHLKEFLEKQLSVLDTKINQYQYYRSVIKDVIESDTQTFVWDSFDEYLDVDKEEYEVAQLYKKSEFIHMGIKIQKEYSERESMESWLENQIQYNGVNRILDLNSGVGMIWKGHTQKLRNRELYLTERIPRLVDDINVTLGNLYNTFVMSTTSIGFRDQFFDLIIVNFLFVTKTEVKQSIEELKRVLNKGGTMYVVGRMNSHISELKRVIEGFDEELRLATEEDSKLFAVNVDALYFTKQFKSCEEDVYIDQIEICDATVLCDYIMSYDGNQSKVLRNRLDEFREYLKKHIDTYGSVTINVEIGVLIIK